MLDHTQATELYSAYCDAELEPAEARAFEEHTKSCLVCRREFVQFQRMMVGLHGLEKHSAPPAFVEGVVARLRKRSGGRFFMPRRWADRVPYELFSVLMLGLLLALHLILQLSQPGRLLLP